MKRMAPGRIACCAIGCTALAWGGGLSLAQNSELHILQRPSVDGGAQRLSGSVFTLTGTVGQFDAGPVMHGATLTLRGGFHVSSPPDFLFSDSFED